MTLQNVWFDLAKGYVLHGKRYPFAGLYHTYMKLIGLQWFT